MSVQSYWEAARLVEFRSVASALQLIDDDGSGIDFDSAQRALAEIYNTIQLELDLDEMMAIKTLGLCWEHLDESCREALSESFLLVLSCLNIAPAGKMVDQIFAESNVYSKVRTLRSQLSITQYDYQNEEYVGKKRFTLTGFQKRLLTATRRSRVCTVSAPTSSGKSFSLYLWVAEQLKKRERCFLCVVPTNALVNQVTRDIYNIFDEVSVSNTQIINDVYDQRLQPPERESEKKKCYVLTQEKARILIQNGLPADCTILIVDEIQNLEGFDDEKNLRSLLLLRFLEETNSDFRFESIVLSGARIQNLQTMGEKIFNESVASITDEVCPVVNLTYSFGYRRHKGKNYWYLRQHHSPGANPDELAIPTPIFAAQYSQQVFNPLFLERFAKLFRKQLMQENTVVFAPVKRTANDIAESISEFKRSQGQSEINSDVEDAIKFAREFVHEAYLLPKTLENGVAYFSKWVPSTIRFLLEMLFKDGAINTIVSTTSIIEGVNLPAKNIIVRRTKLYGTGQNLAELSYYDLANLRGRAGRLLTDFVGRAFLLSETDLDEPAELDHDSRKSITPNFRQKYEAVADEIDQIVFEESSADTVEASPGARWLALNMRQACIREGANFEGYLWNMGIDANEEVIGEIKREMSSLTVPWDLCREFPTWDPVDIDRLYLDIGNGNAVLMPQSIELPQRILEDSLKRALMYIGENFSYYASREFGNSLQVEKYAFKLARGAVSWARGHSLREILIRPEVVGETPERRDAVDDEIEFLTDKVGYAIPAVLGPLATLSGYGGAVLNSISKGTYFRFDSHLLSLGLGREAAILVRQKCWQVGDWAPNLDGDIDLAWSQEILVKNSPSLPGLLQKQCRALRLL